MWGETPMYAQNPLKDGQIAYTVSSCWKKKQQKKKKTGEVEQGERLGGGGGGGELFG